jgi:hypothetical protein
MAMPLSERELSEAFQVTRVEVEVESFGSLARFPGFGETQRYLLPPYHALYPTVPSDDLQKSRASGAVVGSGICTNCLVGNPWGPRRELKRWLPSMRRA